MSAPTTHDPLVVNTKDGTTWSRRAVTQDGHGLYAVTDSCKCPEYLLATLAELAERGIVGSADVLPMPVSPEPQALSAEWRVKLAVLIGDSKPARDGLLTSFGESIRDRREHDHTTQREDWFCMNLSAYMGERMAPVLRRLLDAEAEAERLRAQVAALLDERHSTNEALDDAVQELRANEAPAGPYPPVMRWAALMDREDLTDFLDELAASAITNASSDVALAESGGAR